MRAFERAVFLRTQRHAHPKGARKAAPRTRFGAEENLRGRIRRFHRAAEVVDRGSSIHTGWAGALTQVLTKGRNQGAG